MFCTPSIQQKIENWLFKLFISGEHVNIRTFTYEQAKLGVNNCAKILINNFLSNFH